MSTFRTAAGSHPGLIRASNEDSMMLRNDVGLWVVADGMGGLQHGKWASAQAVSVLESLPLGHDFPTNSEAIGNAIGRANDLILATGRERRAQVGTTVAALHISGASFLAAWVGDSRIYLFRGEELRQISRDHSQVQEMLDAGLLSAAEARHHPKAHVLSRALGVEARVRPEVKTGAALAQDTFLLCSDGLNCVVQDYEIAQVVSREAPDVAVSGLIELALRRGAPDNVTVVLVRCEGN